MHAQQSAAAEHYAEQTIDLFRRLLTDVIRDRAPAVEAVFAAPPAAGLDVKGLQALGIWLQLLTIAEEVAATSYRRRLEVEAGRENVPGTFAKVLSDAAAAGVPASAVQAMLDHASVQPVITAHPTEAKRVTVLEIHRRIYLLLVQLEGTRWTPRERTDFIERLRGEIDLLWLTGELRLEKPTVEQEIAWGLHFFQESLFARAPDLYAALGRALRASYPGDDFRIPAFFSFGTWIGGDRDGNPFVTEELTFSSLRAHRRVVLERYRRRLAELCRRLSIAEHTVSIPDDFRQSLGRLLERTGRGPEIRARNPGELYRQFAQAMSLIMDATLAAGGPTPERGGGPGPYRDADEFVRDLEQLRGGLEDAACTLHARLQLEPLLFEVKTFRFQTAELDLRDNAQAVNAAVADLWPGLTGDPGKGRPEPRTTAWCDWLSAELAHPMERLPGLDTFGPAPPALLGLFRGLAAQRQRIDKYAMRRFVLSMTRSAADVLGVYVLAKYGGLFADPQGVEYSDLLVVPLFETIDDLRRAPQVMRELHGQPVIRRTLRRHGGHHEVMIGYSDSNKDGGFLTSNWELNRIQMQLSKLGAKLGLPVRFFHGRGGSVSRGGVPTGRAIAAQPAGSVDGHLRVTEQGEVVSAKYANQSTAAYHMELLSASVFEHSLKSVGEKEVAARIEYDDAMDALSGAAFAAYRMLVEHPGLVDYYQAASPVAELNLLNMGSRPARRTGAQTLADLRAIPWVFAWTQNRHLVPGWYGLGSGLAQFLKVRGETGLEQLRRMFEEHRLFRLIIDEVEKVLLQVDQDVARRYAGLLASPRARSEVLDMVEREYECSVENVLRVSGAAGIGDRFPRYRAKLGRRLPILKEIGYEQVRLLHGFRARKTAAAESAGELDELVALLLSFNCVANGLGATG